MVNAIKVSNATYFAFNSDISFYAAKSYARQPLQNTFEIGSILAGYSLVISMFKKSSKANKGVITFKSAPRIQFTGELIEFDLEELSENESTIVLKGDLNVLGKTQEKTFLGSIKKVDGTVYINANLSLDKSEYEFENIFECATSFNNVKAITVEIMLQLKA